MSIRRFPVGLIASVFLLAFGSSARGQYMKGETVLSGSAGLVFPTGAFNDLAKSGYGLCGSVERILNPSWAVGVRLSYATFDADTVDLVSVGPVRTRYLGGDAFGKLFLYPESWFTPYATGGGGFYRERTWTRTGGSDETTDASRLVLIGGFGLSAHRQAQRMNFFTEVLYHHALTNAVSRQYIQWNAGLRFSFGGRPF
jgi:hypothetical protein